MNWELSTTSFEETTVKMSLSSSWSISGEEISSFETFNAYQDLPNLYEDSPFLLFKTTTMSSKRKGAAFEKLFEEFMVSRNDFSVLKNENSDHDRVLVHPLSGKKIKIEIKGSLLWDVSDPAKHRPNFKWQQIRTEQDYDIIIFICIYPEGIDFFWSTKEEASTFLDVPNERGEWVYNQHGGKRVRSGTFCISGRPEDFSFFHPIDDLIYSSNYG